MHIARGIIRGFNPAAWQADVEIVGAPTSLLAGVPVAADLGPDLLPPGSKVWVCLSEEGNPADGAVLAPYGAAPSPWVTARMWKPGLATAERAAAVSCSSTDLVNVPDLGVTLTLEVPGNVLLFLAATGELAASGIAYTMAFYHDDAHEVTQLSPIETVGGPGAAAGEAWNLAWLALQSGVAPGDHTFVLKHRVSGGGATLARGRVVAIACG